MFGQIGADGRLKANVTLDMVAQISGVSPKTASRVLRGKTTGFSDTTRTKVQAVAAQLGYVPNASARSLARQRSDLLALVYDNVNASYVLELQLGATRRCRQLGYHLIIEPILPGASAVQTIRRMLDNALFQGVILAPPLCEDAEVLAVLEERKVACARIAPVEDRANMASVRNDDRFAAAHATAYLLMLGHADIAFITGPAHGPAANQRLAGFQDAVAQDGRPIAVRLDPGDFTFRSGFEAATRLLSGERRPTAIFAANDEMAFGAIAAAHRLQLSVPHDVSVVGFDDSPAARAVWPALTTVRQPIQEMAAAAANLLADQGGAAPVQFASELVVRGSSGPAPGVAA